MPKPKSNLAELVGKYLVLGNSFQTISKELAGALQSAKLDRQTLSQIEAYQQAVQSQLGEMAETQLQLNRMLDDAILSAKLIDSAE